MVTINAIDIPTGASGTLLQGAGVGTAPAFSTSTYPATNAVSTLLYASSANVMGALASANRGILSTSSAGVPSIAVSAAFTPVLAFGGASVGITYSAQVGAAIQFGNLVFITLAIILSSKGSSTGTATITGLPVASGQASSIANYIVCGNVAALTCVGIPVLFIANGATSGTVQASSNGTLTTLTDVNFANNTTLYVQGFYTTT